MRHPVFTALPLSCACLALLLCAPAACTVQPGHSGTEIDSTRYYSDYFVFLAEDGANPLIVLTDINWEQQAEGTIFTELKAYYGTDTGPWPILYDARTRSLHRLPLPTSWPDVPPIDQIGWNRAGSRFAFAFDDPGGVTLKVPSFRSGAAISDPGEDGHKTLKAARTTVRTPEGTRSGWLIHEEVRLNELQKTGGISASLARFHWIPVVVADTLYLFEQDGMGRQRAVRWQDTSSTMVADTLHTFGFEVTDTRSDGESGRAEVPVRWRIEVPTWHLALTLASRAGHTGYGEVTDKGKALFRQALVTGHNRDGTATYGMLELILAD